MLNGHSGAVWAVWWPPLGYLVITSSSDIGIGQPVVGCHSRQRQTTEKHSERAHSRDVTCLWAAVMFQILLSHHMCTLRKPHHCDCSKMRKLFTSDILQMVSLLSLLTMRRRSPLRENETDNIQSERWKSRFCMSILSFLFRYSQSLFDGNTVQGKDIHSHYLPPIK